MSDPTAFDDLIERVADGGAVDWAAAERRFIKREDVARLRNLKLIAQLADSHRWIPADEEGSTRLPVAAQPNDRAAERWGRYVLLRKIGEGGYGQVYLARDEQLDREVALKILRRKAATRESLEAEGRALARVDHPNVLAVYGVEEHNGELALCMKYIRGRTLQELVEDSPLNADEAVVVARAVCGAVAAVHTAGVLHRDIKARNVMRERSGRYVLMDFGAGLVMTPNGSWGQAPTIGTLQYMAPELLTGVAPPSRRSDVYSLGVLLYFLVTGSYPIEGATADEVRRAHTMGQRTPLDERRSDLPESYLRAVECATALNPDERPHSATELLRMLSARSGVWPRLRALGLPLVAFASVVLFSGMLTTYTFNLVVDRPTALDTRGLAEVLEMGLRSLIVPAFVASLTLAGVAVLSLLLTLVPWPRRWWSALWRRLLAGLGEEDYARAIAQGAVLVGTIAVLLVMWAFGDIVIAFVSSVSRHDIGRFAVFLPENAAQRVGYRTNVVLLLLSVVLVWGSVRNVRLKRGGTVPEWIRATALALIVVLFVLSQAPYKLMNYNALPVVVVDGVRCYLLGEASEEVRVFCPAFDVPRVRTVRATQKVERCDVEENLFLARTTPLCTPRTAP